MSLDRFYDCNLPEGRLRGRSTAADPRNQVACNLVAALPVGACRNQALAWLQSLTSFERFYDRNLPEGRLRGCSTAADPCNQVACNLVAVVDVVRAALRLEPA
jgi:hypothetical protein